MRRCLCLLVLLALPPLRLWSQQPPSAKPASPPQTRVATPLPSKATVESFLRHMFGYDPDVRWAVGDITPSPVPDIATVVVRLEEGGQPRSLVLYVTSDQQHALVGEMLPFGADPFARARTLLNRQAQGPARGPEDAALTIIEFSDLQCPHCKLAQPVIEKLLADFPNARFVFQNFPLEALHPWAFKAAQWADCVAQQSNPGFWKYVQSVYDDQLEITEQNADQQLRRRATAAAVDATIAATCVANPETARRVNASLELGRALEVNGTPTLFVNGRKVEGLTSIPYEVLRQIVQFQAGQGK